MTDVLDLNVYETLAEKPALIPHPPQIPVIILVILLRCPQKFKKFIKFMFQVRQTPLRNMKLLMQLRCILWGIFGFWGSPEGKEIFFPWSKPQQLYSLHKSVLTQESRSGPRRWYGFSVHCHHQYYSFPGLIYPRSDPIIALFFPSSTHPCPV